MVVPPDEVTAGVAVFDRWTGELTHRLDAERPFRSASVVKLLIALDLLLERGPGYDVPPEDRDRLEPMLHGSHDGHASHYWAERGGGAIVTRTAGLLGLTGTLPPPPERPGFWGSTALTAADTVRVYRYLLDEAPAPVRDFVMGALRRATRIACDGYDQFFGIPTACDRPWAVKQGWSGFDRDGTPSPSARTDLDLVSAVLHSTGTVGEGDRAIVAVLTAHPEGTPYAVAGARTTELVAALDIPGHRDGLPGAEPPVA